MPESDEFQVNPPQHKVFTKEELSEYDGIKSPKIYLAIKDTVFDVSSNKDSYGPNGGYHVFAGKDATRALAKSSLEEEDCIGDYVDLPASDIETLNDWFEYFKLRYSIMGTLDTAADGNPLASSKPNGAF